MRVVVAGASGLIGSALLPVLEQQGREVVRLVRRAPGAGEVRWDPANGHLDPRELEGVEAGICLSGAGVGDKRWNDSYKRQILASRVDTTGLLARTLGALTPRPRVLLAGSAIGYYGERGEEPLTESSSAGTGFLSDVVQRWEASADPAREAGLRVVHLRTGIVQGRGGGAYDRQELLFKLGLGGPLGTGRQWQSWITLDDEVRAIAFLLEADVAGPVNVVAPQPVRQKDLAKALGRALHRPALLPVPKLALRAVLGEFASDVLGSQRVLPGALTDAGFTWNAPDIDTAYRQVTARD
ncbi:MAG TPA: TIGR01777 family oxidoreductase [Mycobacteriales bacterium]|nr:TIGR01777 family oxidoreductase [Mycobacteriales bacterium]